MADRNDRIRLTISVSPEVHATFTAMAETAGMSLSRCMGEWLEDTIESAQFVTTKMQEARSAPAMVLREMRLGIPLGTTHAVHELATTGKLPRRQPVRSSAAGAGAPVPPSSNTGGKSPGKTLTYSAINPVTGQRTLLPVGKCFGRDGTVKDEARPVKGKR